VALQQAEMRMVRWH